MSHSPAHDALFPAVEAYLRDNEKVRSVLREPARPRNWPDRWPWPAVDLMAFRTGYDTISVDVKVSRADMLAQLEKPYVENNALGVGNRRYIAIPADFDGNVTAPDGWGVLRVDGQTVTEQAESWCFRWERNWSAEQLMATAEWLQFGDVGQGMKVKGVHASRKLADNVVALLSDGQVTLGRAAKEAGTTPGKLEKALDERVVKENVGGRTYLRLAE